MDIQLHPYQDEIPIVVALIQDFWKEHNHYDQSKDEAMEDLRHWTMEGHQLYLIKADAVYVGFVHLGSRGGQTDWLEDIYVKTEYQNRGIGTQTIKLVEDIVSKYSESLYIEAAARNERAIRLYRRAGYDCLNTITVRKDFIPENHAVIRGEKIYDLDFEIRQYIE